MRLGPDGGIPYELVEDHVTVQSVGVHSRRLLAIWRSPAHNWSTSVRQDAWREESGTSWLICDEAGWDTLSATMAGVR